MNSTKLVSIGLAAALTAVLPAIPAQATSLTRTFVSSAGLDSNPCTITQPCATFAHAYTLTAANGIIAALDPGKYGPLNITGPVTVNGNGWAAITAPAAGSGITINANSGDNVALIGLEIDGAGAAYNGIVFNVGGSLTISNCTVQNFFWTGIGQTTGNGIFMQPTSGTVEFIVTNTILTNNQAWGIHYYPLSGTPVAKGTIDHVVANANGSGIGIDASSIASATTVTVTNSIISNNTYNGIAVANLGPLKMAVDNVTISGNGQQGINATGTSNVLLGRSLITTNNTGVLNQTSPNTFYTYKNNQINLNVFDVTGTMNTTFGFE